MAIQSFGDCETEEFFLSGRTGKRVAWAAVKNIVGRKLDMLHYAAQLGDLKVPPGNRLELLKGNLTGYCSLRVNDRWRVIFKWDSAGPKEVRVADYH